VEKHKYKYIQPKKNQKKNFTDFFQGPNGKKTSANLFAHIVCGSMVQLDTPIAGNTIFFVAQVIYNLFLYFHSFYF